jgi:hypothetical protein
MGFQLQTGEANKIGKAKTKIRMSRKEKGRNRKAELLIVREEIPFLLSRLGEPSWRSFASPHLKE